MTNEDDVMIDQVSDEVECVRQDLITNMEDAQARFDNNIKKLEGRWGNIVKQAVNYEPLSELVFLENGEPDVLFKGTYLYNGEGAYTFSRTNIDNYWKKPVKLFSNAPDPQNIDKHAREYFNKTLEKVKDCVVFSAGNAFRDNKKGNFLFCLGVGLGAHFDEMIETTQAQVVIIIESNFDFIYQSLFICDWASMLEKADENGKRIELQIISDAKYIANTLGASYRRFNPTTVDGTIVFQHYPSSTYQNAFDIFIKKIFRLALMGLGFFEDELNMIAHSYENFSTGKSRIMRNVQDKVTQSFPVIIVGNGPSLDGHFEYIKKVQDRAIIISCGTALDALLSQGIYPDFQIHLERDVEELRLYRYTAKNHDLSKICLVSSSTVYPGIADMFGETIYFFRPGLSSMPIFMASEEERLNNPDPSVTNAGFAFALQVGFKEMYFFGTDVGAQDAQHHHSKKSLYHVEDMDLPWYIDPKHNAGLTNSLTVVVPGNFGGEVVSSDLLLWTKNNLESAAKNDAGGRFIYNCSDGALIEGFTPLLPARLKLPESSIDKKVAVENFINKFPVYDKRTFDLRWKKADIFNRIEKMADDLIATMDEYPMLEDQRYSTLMMKYLQPSESVDGIAMLYRGTLFLYQIAMHHFLNRIVNDDKMVETFRDAFREDLSALICALRDEAISYFRDAENGDIDYEVPLDRNAVKVTKKKTKVTKKKAKVTKK